MRVLLMCLCVLIFLGVSGCGSGEKPNSVLVEDGEKIVSTEKNIEFSKGTTVGNHTYLPINIYGVPADHVEILQILKKFEETHPELEITSWSIEKQQMAHMVSAYIYGIWINHRPKK